MRKALLLLLLIAFEAISASPILTPSIRVHYDSKSDLKADLEKIVSEESISDIFDRIDGEKIEISLINDYAFNDPNSPDLEKLRDDIGLTHGLKLSILKNIAPLEDGSDKYYISVKYETNLHTNVLQDIPRPMKFHEIAYKNERGFWQVDIAFKEENLLRMMIGKMKSGNAMYYEVGVGFQEINTEDNSRGFILSSVAQQAWHHQNINDMMGATLREYNYNPSPGGDKSITFEGEIGYDHTLYETPSSRSFVRAGMDTRISGINGASFVGTYIRFGQDYRLNDYLPAIRVAGGIHYKRFKEEEYKKAAVGATLSGKHAALNFRYIIPFDRDPSYLQVLPPGVRPADIEPLIELSVQGKL